MAFSSDIPLQSNQVPISIDFPEPTEKNFNEILTLDRKRIVSSLNTKEGGLYQLQEQATFQNYYSTTTNNTFAARNTYRRVYDLVALNGAPIPIGVTYINLTGPNAITGIFQSTRGYGSATIAGPIYVFYPGTDGNIRFDNTVPATQVLRITNASGSPWTTATYVIEYTKN